MEHFANVIFIETPARQDAYILETAVVQNAADALGQCGQISAVQANAADNDPIQLQPWRKRDDLLGGSFGVIRIDQNRQVSRA